MICKPCRTGNINWMTGGIAKRLRRAKWLHERCEAPATCPCHHIIKYKTASGEVAIKPYGYPYSKEAPTYKGDAS